MASMDSTIPFPQVIEEQTSMLMRPKMSTSDRLLVDMVRNMGLLPAKFGPYNHWILHKMPQQLEDIHVDLKDGYRLHFVLHHIRKPEYKNKDGKILPLSPRLALMMGIAYVAQVFIHLEIRLGDKVMERTPEPIPFFEFPAMLGSVVCNLHGLNAEQRKKAKMDPDDPLGYYVVVPPSTSFKGLGTVGMAKPVYLEAKDNMRMEQAQLMQVDGKYAVAKMTTWDGNQTYQVLVRTQIRGGKTAGVMYAQSIQSKDKLFSNVFVLYYILETMAGRTFSMERAMERILSFAREEDRSDIRNALAPSIGPFENIEPFKDYATRLGVQGSTNFREEVKEHVEAMVFPTAKDFDRRIDNLIILIIRLAEYMIGKREMDPRDHWKMKRLESDGGMCQQHLGRALIKALEKMSKELKARKPDIATAATVVTSLGSSVISEAFSKTYTSATWGFKTSGRTEAPGTNPMPTEGNLTSILSLLSAMRRPGSTHVKSGARQVGSGPGVVGLWDTPEGESIGLRLFLTILTNVSLDHTQDPTTLRKIQKHLVLKEESSPEAVNRLIYNGIFLGWTRGKSGERRLRKLKRTGRIHRDTEIVFDEAENSLFVYTSGAIPIRPLLVVKDGEILAEKLGLLDAPIVDLLAAGAIEYMTPYERSMTLTSYSLDNFYLQKKIRQRLEFSLQHARDGQEFQPPESYIGFYNMETEDTRSQTVEELEAALKRHIYETDYQYCEISPTGILTWAESVAPLLGMSPSPRLTYQASMGRSAIGKLNQFASLTFPRSSMYIYPTGGFTATPLSIEMGQDAHSPDHPVIMAVLPWAGNQEDSLIVNRASVERGLMHAIKEYSRSGQEQSTRNGQIQIEPVPMNHVPKFKREHYRHITERGYARIGSIVEEGDVLISLVHYKTGSTSGSPSPITVNKGEYGIVDRVSDMTDSSGNRTVQITVRQMRVPIPGDKAHTNTAQKGILAVFTEDVNMPFVPGRQTLQRVPNGKGGMKTVRYGDPEFTLYGSAATMAGVKPDIIINPLAFPTRMTIGLLAEAILNLIGIETATKMDLSSFREDMSIGNLLEHLERLGLKHLAYTTMHSGITGELLHGAPGRGVSSYGPASSMYPSIEQMRGQTSSGASSQQRLGGIIGIFPNVYRRNPQTVSSKVQARNSGGNQLTTRQPVGGRQQNGGLRFGRMEKDAILTSGLMSTAKGRLGYDSDMIRLPYCEACSEPVIHDPIQRGFECRSCGLEGKEGFVHVDVPYIIFVLLWQLALAGIRLKLNIVKTEEGVFVSKPYDSIYGSNFR